MHKLCRKYNLTVPIKPSIMSIGTGELNAFPYIPFSAWVRYLMDEGLVAQQLCGVAEEHMPQLLEEFWARYRAVHPRHPIFNSSLPLQDCIPCYSHCDEGRAYKKQGLLLLSVHGCLGLGTRSWRKRGVHKNTLKRNGMGLNYLGNSWSRQFYFCSLHRSAYAKNFAPLEMLLQTFATDMSVLSTNGAPLTEDSSIC